MSDNIICSRCGVAISLGRAHFCPALSAPAGARPIDLAAEVAELRKRIEMLERNGNLMGTSADSDAS